MFEKEAKEYLKKDGTKAEQILDMLNEISPLEITLKQVPFILAMIQQVFKDGAEFGYNKCKEELEKENAELKKQLEMSNKVYNDNLDYSYHIEGQLTKAKELLTKWAELFKPKGGNIPPTPIQVETEQFISEVEK